MRPSNPSIRPGSSLPSPTRGGVAARVAEALLWLVLLSPWWFGLFALRADDGRLDVWVLIGGVASVVWMLWLRALPLRPRTLHLMLLPLVVVASIEWAMMLRFHTRLTTSYLTVAWINLHQYPEFLATFGAKWGAMLAGLLVVWYAAWRQLAPLPRVRAVRTLAITSVILSVAYGGMALRSLSKGADLDEALMDIAARESSAPVGLLMHAGAAAHAVNQWADVRRQRRSVAVQAQAQPDAAEVVVWFLGESARAESWSLFGYERDTTPNLSAMAKSGDIVAFKGWANSPHTWMSVTSMLSLKPIADLERMIGTPSIVKTFEAAGYEVHWLSTQKVDGFQGPIGEIAAETGRPRFFSGAWDEKLAEELAAVLAQPGPQRRFVVLHGKGSHFDYSRRYPEPWAKWQPTGPTGRERIVNSYDNSLRYTDEVLRQVIATLQSTHRRAVLVYASDHGESLMDDHKQLLGHAVGNSHDLSVPAFFWASAAMRTPSTTAKFEQARRHLSGLEPSRPMNSDLPHALLDLSGVSSPDLDLARSVFAPNYTTKDRWIIAHGDKQTVESLVRLPPR
jgi:glucan phosphoethanolaminetransferase (alkaline phosphatase superfamily)